MSYASPSNKKHKSSFTRRRKEINMKKEITKDQIRLACYEILGTRRSEEDRNKIVKLENFSIFGERRLKEDLLDNLKKKLVFCFECIS